MLTAIGTICIMFSNVVLAMEGINFTDLSWWLIELGTIVGVTCINFDN